MNKIVQLIIAVQFILFSTNLVGQETEGTLDKSHSISLKIQYKQIEDEVNYGLVFSGPNLAVTYTQIRESSKNTLEYNTELAFGLISNKGASMALRIKPIDLFYGYNINKSKSNPLTLGGYFSTDYQWQVYPELQSGHMFWFTSIEVGPQIEIALPIKTNQFRVKLSNSISGFTSRPLPATETYFYSLNVSDFISNAHSNLNFGSLNAFSHTQLEIALLAKNEKRLSVAYEFDYLGYYENPRISFLTHSISLNWKIGKL